jgi:hypothetical protein
MTSGNMQRGGKKTVRRKKKNRKKKQRKKNKNKRKTRRRHQTGRVVSFNTSTHIFSLLSQMITSQVRSELDILSPHLSLSMVLNLRTVP